MHTTVSPRLLIADPCPDNRWTLAALAKHDGCEVQTAGTPAEALLYCSTVRPDVLLIEVIWERTRPDIGYGIIEQVLREDQSPAIVVISGYQTQEHLDQCRRLGVPHVLKPYASRELLALVRERTAVAQQRVKTARHPNSFTAICYVPPSANDTLLDRWLRDSGPTLPDDDTHAPSAFGKLQSGLCNPGTRP